MPRLVGYRERTVRDFGWILPLAQGERVDLFTPERLTGSDLTGTGIHPSWLTYAGVQSEHQIIITELAIDRPDVVVEIKIRERVTATVCGPWLNPVVGQLWSIWSDALKEDRPEEAQAIAAEAKKESRKTGLGIAVIVPVRVYLQATARLLAGAAEGQAMIHIRTLVTREVH